VRAYDPATSSVKTIDEYSEAPAATSPGASQDPLNEDNYTSVNGDPVNLQEPSGHEATACGAGAGCICRGALGRPGPGFTPAVVEAMNGGKLPGRYIVKINEVNGQTVIEDNTGQIFVLGNNTASSQETDFRMHLSQDLAFNHIQSINEDLIYGQKDADYSA
jgi:hypothetical protein